ncbi:MAG: stalk domain-containing protein [Candidatus Aquicultor sp.]
MKKLISALLVVLMILAVPGGLATAGTGAAPHMKASSADMTTLVFKLGSLNYTVNGAARKLDVAPFSTNGRTLIPIRYALEPLGGQVSWDQAQQKVTVSLEPVDINLWVGNATADINGVKVPIDANNSKVMPVNVKGRIFVPLRFVLEAISADIIWGPDDKSITIRCPKPDMITYDGTEFVMDYPEIWDVLDEDLFIAFSSPEYEGVIVETEALSGMPMTLDEYTDANIDLLRTIYPGITFIQSTDVTIGGNPWYLVVYTAKFEGTAVKSMEAWTVVNNKAYRLTYDAEAATYDNYVDTAAEMFDSFKIK